MLYLIKGQEYYILEEDFNFPFQYIPTVDNK